jgi:hypothetical protein
MNPTHFPAAKNYLDKQIVHRARRSALTIVVLALLIVALAIYQKTAPVPSQVLGIFTPSL